jgi:hypothetical protein
MFPFGTKECPLLELDPEVPVKSVICRTRPFAALLSLIACWITGALPLRAQDGKPGSERDLAQRYLYLYRIGLAEREWAANNVQRAAEVLDECPAPLRHWEWNYLKRLCGGSRITFTGHRARADCVAFSPDGKVIASGGFDLKLWDAATGKEIRSLDSGN